MLKFSCKLSDSLDFALNPVFMTLVSAETLCEQQGPAVGSVSERHQVKSRAQGAGRSHVLCATRLSNLHFIEGWQVTGNL